MESFGWYDYVFWLPLLLWVGLFFWFYRRAYPVFLKKMVKKGKKWAYVPEFISKNPGRVGQLKFFCFLLSLLVSAASSFSVVWGLGKVLPDFAQFGFAATLLFMILAAVLYHQAMGKVAAIFQSAYFLEYRRVHYASDVKGNFQNEADIHYKTVWSFTKRLRNAEEHHRLWKYVNAMAKTKKIPPDIYAETMYV